MPALLPSNRAIISAGSQWANIINLILRSTFACYLARSSYIHACLLIATCLARSTIAQPPLTIEVALLELDAMSIKVLFPQKCYSFLQV